MGSIGKLFGKAVYLDANIFIYAIEQPNSIKEYSTVIKALFAGIDSGEITVITSELTLAEVLSGAYKQFPELIEIYDELLTDSYFLQVCAVDREILKESALLRSLSKISLADAIHVATARIYNADIILTHDKKMQVPKPLEKFTLDELL